MIEISQWGRTSSEDPTCYISCCKGERPLASDHRWVECPKCHRRYRTQFFCYQLEPGESEPTGDPNTWPSQVRWDEQPEEPADAE